MKPGVLPGPRTAARGLDLRLKARGARDSRFKMGFTHTLRRWETFNDRRRSA